MAPRWLSISAESEASPAAPSKQFFSFCNSTGMSLPSLSPEKPPPQAHDRGQGSRETALTPSLADLTIRPAGRPLAPGGGEGPALAPARPALNGESSRPVV